jgi:hypothetical protein
MDFLRIAYLKIRLGYLNKLSSRHACARHDVPASFSMKPAASRFWSCRWSVCNASTSIIATTPASEDDAIVAVAEAMGIGCFRGSEEDVLDRYCKAARCFKLDIDVPRDLAHLQQLVASAPTDLENWSADEVVGAYRSEFAPELHSDGPHPL